MSIFYNEILNIGGPEDTNSRKLYESKFFPYLEKRYKFLVMPDVSNRPDLLSDADCSYPISKFKYIDVKRINNDFLNYDLQCHSNTGSACDDWLRSGFNPSEMAIMYLRCNKIVVISLEDYIDLVKVWYPNAEPNYQPFLCKMKTLERKNGITKGSRTAYYLVYNFQIDQNLSFIAFEDDDVPIMLYRRNKNEN